MLLPLTDHSGWNTRHSHVMPVFSDFSARYFEYFARVHIYTYSMLTEDAIFDHYDGGCMMSYVFSMCVCV